jgi:glycosyltransferase involved in cell wall biosynthesis
MIVIADYFASDVQGGGELCTEEIISFLQKKEDRLIRKHRSHEVTEQHIKGATKVIVSNFINLPDKIKKMLIADSPGREYFIIEHDHKYCKARNPLAYPGMIVPEQDLLHRGFYKNAKAVFCQSRAHAEILQKNLWIDNVVNLGCNLWSDTHLQQLETLVSKLENGEIKKTYSHAVMQSPNPIKGTKEAIELCRTKNIDPIKIIPQEQSKFWNELALTQNLVFLPQTYETYCRVAIEAKILGCNLVSNKAIGAMSEPYWNQNNRELLETVKKKKTLVLELVHDIIKVPHQYWSHQKPQVSVITTVYKGAKHLKGFLDAFVEQDNRKNHELIIIDANSPENESEIVQPYLEKYPNIHYEKINEKKTTMECFNIATDKAKGDYIAMCMVDDRLAPFHLDLLSKQLFLYPDIDLVYGDSILVDKDNQDWNKVRNSKSFFDHSKNHFTKEGMIKNLPGPLPMYRKSLHYKIGGYRKEILHAGDWEFYLRAVKNGSRFKKIDIPVGLYYVNPDGLSTTNNEKIVKERRKSEQQIFEEYKEVFGETVYNQFKPYFDQWR